MKIPHYILRAFFVAVAAGAPLWILLTHTDPASGKPFDWPRFGSWLCCMAGMLGLFVLAGLKIRGRAFGVLIDERNRYALSRLQITLWTVLVLATVYVVFVANTVRGSGGGALNVDLDPNLVALMGLSLASFVAAPMALSLKTSQPGDAGELARTGRQLRNAQGLDSNPSATGRVLTKNSATNARLADLIRGEDIGNANVVDLPKLQMLLITAVVVLAYGGVVGHMLGTDTWLLAKFPVLSNTVLMLVLVSHGGYVAGKLIPTSSSSVSPQYATRALQASQRAASLAADLQVQLDATAPGDPRYGWLRGSLALAQGVAAEASALPSRFAVADFKPDEISNIEGRVDALRASLGAQPSAPSARQMADAPSTETVSRVQQRLYTLGHADVRVTGIADAATEQAIRDSLAQLGVRREDLHPRPFRYYEEIAQLI